jgi:subtilase family serine protease
MIFHRFLLSAVVFGAAVVGMSQGASLVPLPMDPPKEILNSLSIGALPADHILHLSVALSYRDAAGIQQFVDAVSDPKSARYRQFITPEQVGSRFGLPAAAVSKVTGYLSSHGMSIRLVAKNRLAILADATVAQAEAAFHTSIESFMPVGPDILAESPHFAYSATPSVPAEIGGYITHVAGMENFTHATPMGYAVTPAQLRTFYNVAPLYSGGAQGKGRTIGISNFDGFRLANLSGWYSNGTWTLPTPSGGIGSNVTDEVPPGDTSGGAGSPAGEGDLDIQSTLAMAPLANVIIYDAGSGSSDLIGVLTLETNDNKADIITESYGWTSTSSSFYTSAHNLHLSMSAEGITYLCASGDHGTYSIPADPYPDCDPEVLVVGGTTTNTSSSGALVSQTGWGYVTSGTQYGSGGGWAVNTLSFNTLPSWQTGKGIPTTINYRLVPDVALNADPNTPYYIYLQAGELGVSSTGLYTGIGGTSAASPTFAGSLADAEEQIIANGGLPANSAGNHRFGRIGNLLYSFNGNSSVFTDITSGSNGTLPNGQTSNAGTGWDFVTGWGCMNFAGFVAAESGSSGPGLKSVSVSSSSVTGGNSITGTVTLTAAAPSSGFTVSLSVSNSTAASVPATVTVASASSSATFSITTSSVSSATAETLTATASGVSVTATFTINPVSISSVTANTSSVVGGVSNVTITATLASPAGPSGTTVTFTATPSAAVKLSATSITIASGQTSGTVTANTSAVASNTTCTVSGTAGGVTKSATFTDQAASLSSFSISPSTVVGGSSTPVSLTVTLNGPAGPTARSVTITTSNKSAAPTPSAVSVPAGATTATATFLTKAVASAKTVTITAKLISSTSQMLTVNP